MADYTVDQLFTKLERADAAGDVDAAKVIADEIRRVQGGSAAPRADFSDVQSSVSSAPAPRAEDAAPAEPDQSFLDKAWDWASTAPRAIGLGARATLGGAADAVGIVADPFIHGVNLLGGNQATMRQSAERLSDTLRLPRPETGEERVASGITNALAGGGGFIGAGRALAAKAPGLARVVGEGLSSKPGAQLLSAASGAGAAGATRESGGGEGAQLLAGLAGGVGPGLARSGLESAVRRAVRGGEAGRQATQRTIEDFAAVGAKPSAGQASGNRVVQGVENLLAGGPTSSGVMSNFIERQADNIGAGLGRLADDIAPGRASASGERAGRAVERGVGQFAQDVAAKRNELYRAADELIPRGTQVPLSRTRQVLAQLSTPTPGAEAASGQLINPQVRSLAQRIESDFQRSRTAGPMGVLAPTAGGLPYQAVRDIRTNIGRDLADFSLSVDRPTAQLKQIYAALAQDLEEAARAQGPQAAQAMNRANNYFRASADRLEQLERVVDKVGGPEKVYNAALSGTGDGATTLRAVLQSLPKEGQRDLAAAVIKRMGLANPGEQGAVGDTFSAHTFLNNWNKVSPEARRALFGRLGPTYANNIDRLASVVENIKRGAKIYANPAGTANKAAALTYGASLVGSLFTGGTTGLLAGGLGANLLARGLTNPRFVGWLANNTDAPVERLPQAILQLKRSSDPELVEIANALEAGMSDSLELDISGGKPGPAISKEELERLKPR